MYPGARGRNQDRLAGQHRPAASVASAAASRAGHRAAPGVPDLYQGDELWNQLLVDPDNRRPVDWEVRRVVLEGLRGGARPGQYSAKFFVTTILLALRARCDGIAAAGYEPLAAPDDVLAFARGADVVVAVPLRPGSEPLTPDALGGPGSACVWNDLLAPLDDTYGRRRPAVFERVA